MDLAPLFTRIEQLAPQFGRVEQDLLALVARGRSGDFKGAMQNARLVLESILRHLVTTELKQTPGKAMVDELLSKFRQPANASVVPIPVLAHMGTVQAWGNVSSHDHAASLNDQAMKLGPEEVGTALNSLVAILSWYAGKYAPPQVAPAGVPPPPARKTNPIVMALAIAIPVLGGGYALWVVATLGPSSVEVANAGVALNSFYKANREPPPSGRCRVSDTRTLIKIAKSPGSLALLRDVELQHPEISYLKARALSESKQPADAELEDALKCPGFAAAHGLKAKLLGKADKKDEAAAELQQALDAEPDWSNAHYNLGLVELSRGRVKEGVEQMKLYTEAEPDDGDGWMMLGAAYEGLARQSPEATDLAGKAKGAFCEAAKRGKAEAKPRCEGT
jgi:hypothetical protein